MEEEIVTLLSLFDSRAPGTYVISELSDCCWMPFNFRNQKSFKNKSFFMHQSE